MGFIQSYFEGVRKAHRDIELVSQFMEVHNNRPPADIATKFLRKVGEDVRVADVVEFKTYRRISRRFQKRVVAAMHGPEKAKAIYGKRTESVREMSVEEAVERYGLGILPVLSEEQIDAMAREHGHYTREDECDSIRAFRARAEQAGGN